MSNWLRYTIGRSAFGKRDYLAAVTSTMLLILLAYDTLLFWHPIGSRAPFWWLTPLWFVGGILAALLYVLYDPKAFIFTLGLPAAIVADFIRYPEAPMDALSLAHILLPIVASIVLWARCLQGYHKRSDSTPSA